MYMLLQAQRVLHLSASLLHVHSKTLWCTVHIHYRVYQFCIAPIVRSGRLEVVKYLIEAQGCSADCTDKDGWTPLHYACR